MISVLRFILLVILWIYSCACMAALLHAYTYWGVMDLYTINWAEYGRYFIWPGIIILMIFVLMGTFVGDWILRLFFACQSIHLKRRRNNCTCFKKARHAVSRMFRLHALSQTLCSGFSGHSRLVSWWANHPSYSASN